MANVITTLLKMDSTQFKTGLKGAQQSIRETDGFVNKAKAGWASALAGFAASPVAIGAATAAVGAFAAQSVQAASDLEESINAVNVTFGESADKILEFGENAAKSVGLANSEFNQLATPLGSILKNAGIQMEEVADKTIDLTQRAADMASVFNTDVSDALGAIQAGLRGEQDPLEKYGVSLSAAKVEARALADTGKETVKQLTDQEKALARVEIILDQTNQTAGDFANTSDSLANQTRTLKAEFKDLQAKAGKELIPVLSDLAGALLDVSDAASEAKSGIEKIPGGKSLLDALGTNLFELPGKAKGEWDDLGRSIGVLPPKEAEARVETDRFADSVNNLGSVADQTAARLAEIPGDLGPRWAAASIPLEAASGAFAEMGDRIPTEELEDARPSVDDLADAFGKLRDKVDFVSVALQEVTDNLDLEDSVDDIVDQFGRVLEAQDDLTDPENLREYNGEVRDLRRRLLELVDSIDTIPGSKKVEFFTEIQSGSLDDLYRILGEVTQGITIPVTFETKKSAFDSLNAIFSAGGDVSAPTFNGSFTPKPAPTTTVYQTNNYPVGTTPTSVNQDQTTYFARNGPR